MAHYRDYIIHPNPKIQQRWIQGGENEFGRLFNGYGDVEGMNVCEWVPWDTIPKDKVVTYARYTVAYRPEKTDEPFRVQITAGGDRLIYDGPVSTQVAGMEIFKILLNSTISTEGAKMVTGDISNMYLESFLKDAEYVRFKIDQIPHNIIRQYNLEPMIRHGFVYAKINRAWYGLKQSGKIAHDDLVEHLKIDGYTKTNTEGLFKHHTRNIAFTLVTDDFAIKYTDSADADHLIHCIRKKYKKFKVDWDAKQYIGINLDWDYEQRTVKLSMQGYVEQALIELEHDLPKQTHKGPSKAIQRVYGQKIQFAETDDSPPMTPIEIKYKQRAVGKFLFYARAIDNTMLHALNDIATSKDNQRTIAAVKYFLNYAACNPNASILYRASDMQLNIESDAAYLVCNNARSRAGGYHYLSNNQGTTFNGPITVIAKVIKNVMSSAAEAEIGALFINAQEAVPFRQCITDLGHHQGPTKINTDNATAHGIINNTMKQKKSKAMDMRFYWIRDRVQQKQFEVQWRPGKTNLADYPTKHHTGQHHKMVRPIYLYDKATSPTTVQGCIKILGGEQQRAMCARHGNYLPKKKVTWDTHLVTYQGQRYRPNSSPKPIKSKQLLTKTIQSLGNARSRNISKMTQNITRRLFSLY